MFRSPIIVAPQFTVMCTLPTCFFVVSSAVGVVGGLCSCGCCEGLVSSTPLPPFSMLAMRFAILALSICAMEMMFPFPRICVAALMVISGISPSSFSSSSICGSYGLATLGIGALGSTTM